MVLLLEVFLKPAQDVVNDGRKFISVYNFVLDEGDINGPNDGSVASRKQIPFFIFSRVNIGNRVEKVLHVCSVCFIFQIAKFWTQLDNKIPDQSNRILEHVFIWFNTQICQHLFVLLADVEVCQLLRYSQKAIENHGEKVTEI